MRCRRYIPNLLDYEEDLDRTNNYRSSYCDQCAADIPDQCICDKHIDLCKECGQDHSYRLDFSGVQTSIDVIFAEQLNETIAIADKVATKEKGGIAK